MSPKAYLAWLILWHAYVLLVERTLNFICVISVVVAHWSGWWFKSVWKGDSRKSLLVVWIMSRHVLNLIKTTLTHLYLRMTYQSQGKTPAVVTQFKYLPPLIYRKHFFYDNKHMRYKNLIQMTRFSPLPPGKKSMPFICLSCLRRPWQLITFRGSPLQLVICSSRSAGHMFVDYWRWCVRTLSVRCVVLSEVDMQVKAHNQGPTHANELIS